MRFIINQINNGGGRIGTLSEFIGLPDTRVETPTAALFTKGASVAHLTADVLSKVFSNSQLLWVPLSSCLQLKNGVKAQGKGLANFAGLPKHVICSTLHDINEVTPSGHFEGDRVPLWTRNGKKKMTADGYLDVMEVFKPNIILAIADDSTSLEGSRRISKPVNRTCFFLDVCMKRYKASPQLQKSAFIGVLVGANRPKDCEACMDRLLLHKDFLTGIALSGLAHGPEDAMKCTAAELEPTFKKIGETIPKNLLRILEGSWNPATVVAAIDHGWDVFDGSYPVNLTDAGLALKLNLDNRLMEDKELCILDLNNKRYNEDFQPILPGCECLSCKKQTRAYIHHLLNTREMLAQVLLAIHNLHHFDQMFHFARHHISSNTFQSFKTSITEQYQLYAAVQENAAVQQTTKTDEKPGNPQENATEPLQKPKKKRL